MLLQSDGQPVLPGGEVMTATLTTHQDPKSGDNIKRTAVIADEHASIVILRKDGTPIAIVNAFDYAKGDGRGCIDVILMDEKIDGHSIVFAEGGGIRNTNAKVEQNTARVDVEWPDARLFAVAFGPRGHIFGG